MSYDRQERGRFRGRSQSRRPRALSSRGGRGRGYAEPALGEERLADIVRQVVQQVASAPVQPSSTTSTRHTTAPRTTYHQQMEAVRQRQREYDEQFILPGEPWHFRSDRKELTYDLVGQVKMVMAKRAWEGDVPPTTQDNLDRFISGLQPLHRDSRLNDQLKSAANGFLDEIRQIMIAHLNRKLEENHIKILRYPKEITAKARELAAAKMAGDRCPPDIEAILREATTERPSTPPGCASRLPARSATATSDAECVKRLRLDEEGATGGAD